MFRQTSSGKTGVGWRLKIELVFRCLASMRILSKSYEPQRKRRCRRIPHRGHRRAADLHSDDPQPVSKYAYVMLGPGWPRGRRRWMTSCLYLRSSHSRCDLKAGFRTVLQIGHFSGVFRRRQPRQLEHWNPLTTSHNLNKIPALTSGRVPKWTNGSDCKSDGSAFTGLNPVRLRGNPLIFTQNLRFLGDFRLIIRFANFTTMAMSHVCAPSVQLLTGRPLFQVPPRIY